MATSGTINTTTINTGKLLEKAIRRCGLMPSILTPEIVQTSLEDLFLFLTSLSVRGVNLWCVDHQLLSQVPGQIKYLLPNGTQDLLNVLQSTHSFVDGTVTSTATDEELAASDILTALRFTVTFSSVPATFNFQTSPDGVVWTTAQSFTDTFVAGTQYWFDLDPSVAAQYFRIHSAGQVVSNFQVCTSIRDIPLSVFNRDDYTAIPNKAMQSSTVTSYYFEKLIAPVINLWPVPSDSDKCLSIYRYHQIEDIGALTNELAIPNRWFEHVCWQWAARLAFEIQGVDPARRQEVLKMASQFEIEAESGEFDGAPTFYAPNISGYTA